MPVPANEGVSCLSSTQKGRPRQREQGKQARKKGAHLAPSSRSNTTTLSHANPLSFLHLNKHGREGMP